MEMENKIINDNIPIKSIDNISDIFKDKALEKGSIENLFRLDYIKSDNANSSKELLQFSDDKDDLEEKELHNQFKINEQEINESSKSNKNYNFETLNRDLADIEERLRATRLSWNKNGKPIPNEYIESGSIQKDVVRKSWSLLDIEKRPYSNGSSLNELDNFKRLSGEKIGCDSPAMSEGLLKWDYGADIGLTQDDSDDMEPITWPVTAEQAQRECQINELNGGIGRRMKISLSQGSFLSSPDPEDRHNLIAKISAEYKSNTIANSKSRNQNNATESTEIISMVNGIYDDLSARQIMEQAEAAEKRLRLRLEAVKAIHLNESVRCNNINENNQESLENENTNINIDEKWSYSYLDSSIPKEHCFNKNESNSNFVTEAVKNQQNKLIEDIIEIHKTNAGEDDCKSPTSVTNTGRTTTMESTHTYSDYGKAPIFIGEAYGSRKENNSIENNYVMYSKQNRETFNDKIRSLDIKEMRNPRLICGIPPELDTISSRETLQMTEEKKDDPAVSSFNKKHNDNLISNIESKKAEDIAENTSDKDISQEHSLQAKWNQFKTMMKDDEYVHLFEKTPLRSAVQYHGNANIKSNEPPNTHRQQSSTTTFTTITNLSPRCDSFATDAFKSPTRDFHSYERYTKNRKNGIEEVSKNKSNSGKTPEEKHSKLDDQRYGSNTLLNGRSRSGKRLTNGNGGGKDNEDNDDEISQTERRKLRHAAELTKFKKRFGSGQLDGETTASELEHDDLSKFKRNLIEKENRKKHLSQMLTDICKEGVAEDSVQELTDISQSSSVDTMLLMNKMSHLLRKKKSENIVSKSRKYPSRKSNKKPLDESTKRIANRKSTNKVVESDDAKLLLKHLMLKQKVKWLADCAREEARRRKIRKLEKLIDLYEQGNPVVIPDDLETDTATLMGSDRESQDELCSQSDSCSFYMNEVTNVAAPSVHTTEIDNYNSHRKQRNRSKSPSFRKQYYNSKQKNIVQTKDDVIKKKKKNYPVSEAWHIPLRENDRHEQEDFNDSNVYNCETQNQNISNRKRYRSPYCAEETKIFTPTNLTPKERLQLRIELELARQRNAHECQKDIRHTKTGNTQVSNGGLAWSIGLGDNKIDNYPPSNSRNENRKSNSCNDENAKDKGNIKSELQLAFENRMDSFISRSRQRQKRIKLAVDERRYESHMNLERARLFINDNGCGTKRRRPVTQPDPLSADRPTRPHSQLFNKNQVIRSSSQNGSQSPNTENLYKPHRRQFSKSEMRIQSAKKYQALPEVQAKYIDERRKAKMQNNRMKMHLYGERILQSLLRNRGPWISDRN